MELAIGLFAVILAVPAFFLSVYNFVKEKVRSDEAPKEVVINSQHSLGNVREISRGISDEVSPMYDNLDDSDRRSLDFDEVS